jgi:hypothetical protein
MHQDELHRRLKMLRIPDVDIISAQFKEHILKLWNKHDYNEVEAWLSVKKMMRDWFLRYPWQPAGEVTPLCLEIINMDHRI